MQDSVLNENGYYRLAGYYNGYPYYVNGVNYLYYNTSGLAYSVDIVLGNASPSNARYQSGDFSSPIGQYNMGSIQIAEQLFLTSSSSSSQSSSSSKSSNSSSSSQSSSSKSSQSSQSSASSLSSSSTAARTSSSSSLSSRSSVSNSSFSSQSSQSSSSLSSSSSSVSSSSSSTAMSLTSSSQSSSSIDDILYMQESQLGDNGFFSLAGYYDGLPYYANGSNYLYSLAGIYVIDTSLGSIYPNNERYQSGNLGYPVGSYFSGFIQVAEQLFMTSSSSSVSSSSSSSSQSSSSVVLKSSSSSSSSYYDKWSERLYSDIIAVYRTKTLDLLSLPEDYQKIVSDAYRYTGWSYPLETESEDTDDFLLRMSPPILHTFTDKMKRIFIRPERKTLFRE